MEISPSWWKRMNSVLSVFTWKPMRPTACSRLCNRDSALVGAFARSAILSAVSTHVIVSEDYRLVLAFFFFLVKSHFLLLDLSMFEVRRLSLCLHSVSKRFVKYHYDCDSFFGGYYTLEVFGPSSFCVWNQMSWRYLQTRVCFLHELLLWFDGLSESVKLLINFSENCFDFF